jgi:hypothetical protein
MQLTWLKNIKKTLLSFLRKHRQYLLFHTKWQIGIIITLPCMYIFKDILQLPNWLTIVCFNFIGALIFWPIDKFIFSLKNKSTDDTDSNENRSTKDNYSK